VSMDTVEGPPLNNDGLVLVEVVEGRVDQFRETLPLLDLNLTGYAENPRGWTATRIETASAKAWTGPACAYRTSGSARGRCIPWSARTAQADRARRVFSGPYGQSQPTVGRANSTALSRSSSGSCGRRSSM